MRGSDFAELKALAAIAERGSFTRAARQLGLSPSALSQSVRNLEDRLGVRLLNRTTRSVAPTEVGRRLLARLQPALDEVEAAVQDVQRLAGKPTGPLRINTARAAAVHLLGPILGPFLAAHPEVVLEVAVDDALLDIVAQGFDAGIRLGEMLEKDMIAVKLGGPLELLAIAAPSYLSRHGVPQHPRDLHQHRCINYRMGRGSLYRWEFERGKQRLEIAVEGPLIVNDATLALQAALDGVGVAYLIESHIHEHIAAGRLARVLESWSPSFPGFYLYYPRQRQMPTTLRALVDWIRKKTPPPAASQ